MHLTIGIPNACMSERSVLELNGGGDSGRERGGGAFQWNLGGIDSARPSDLSTSLLLCIWC